MFRNDWMLQKIGLRHNSDYDETIRKTIEESVEYTKCPFEEGDIVCINKRGMQYPLSNPVVLIREHKHRNVFHVIKVDNYPVTYYYTMGTISLLECCGRFILAEAGCNGHDARCFTKLHKIMTYKENRPLSINDYYTELLGNRK